MTNATLPVLGLDIGGTKLAAGVVTPDGETLGFVVTPTRREEGPDRIIPRIFELGRQAMAHAGVAEIGAVGVSCGGPLDGDEGVLLSPLHLPGWNRVPITAMAQREFGVPAVLENDATAGALGEYRYGAGRGTDTMLYLTVSTGVGGGAVVDGRLHRGAARNGGEFGHIVVRSGGRQCLCGRQGCLEMYASGTSIAARATEAVAERGAGSSLASLPVICGEDVAAAALAGDILAVELWDETVDLLATGVTDLVNVLEPNLVVLGGGVTRSGGQLLTPLRAAVLRDAMPPAAAAARIELAQLGDAVCVAGAGAVAFERVLALGTTAELEREAHRV